MNRVLANLTAERMGIPLFLALEVSAFSLGEWGVGDQPIIYRIHLVIPVWVKPQRVVLLAKCVEGRHKAWGRIPGAFSMRATKASFRCC